MDMKTFSKSSLIISTYNWPEALRLCLLSVLGQSVLPDEVIIADDGSTGQTADVVEAMRPLFPVKLIHVWQEDNGFQLSKIRNKAIAMSSCDYIIQVDGDLIFSVSTGIRPIENPVHDILRLGHAAAVCLSRAMARAIYHATPAPGDTVPTWREKWGR